MTYLRGPNIWTYRPVVEAWVDIGALEDSPSNTIPGFFERLTSWLPTLSEHRCGVGEPGGFLERLREGTWPAHIMEHLAIELQNLAGVQAGFGKARQTSVRGVYKLAVRARNEQVGRAALEAAREMVLAGIEARPFDVVATVTQLRDMVDRHHLGPSTECIVDAAAARRIPWLRLNEGNLVQLGHGANQRRIWTAETDQTSAIAEGIASDKDLTKRLLQACGVPIPAGRIVSSATDAWAAAEEIGVPVVMKPSDANHARGVSLELTRREDIEAAFHVADAEGSDVMVERHVPGTDHRLLVVGGRVVAAAKGEQLFVTGNGEATVRQLIDGQLNSDPRRGDAEEFPLETIILEREPVMRLLLARQGMDGDSVPAAGQRVLIQRTGNWSVDCTDEVHEDVAAAAALAARVVGLDITGIDLVVEDIGRPLEEQRGAIVEVNAGPSLLMHIKPAQGKPRPVGEAIVGSLFPNGEHGRIPIVGIAGTRETTAVARMVALLLHLAGRHVGLACRDGLFLDRRRVEKADSTSWQAGQRLLMNRGVEAAVFETGAESILSEGLAYDRCQVGIVTDADMPDALRDYYVDQPEQMYDVLRTQVDVVLPEGTAVLNAADSIVARMAELCDGEVIFYAADDSLGTLAQHRAKGGRALFARGAKLVQASGPDETSIVDLGGLLSPRADASSTTIEAMLAAVAAAWAFGISSELIRAGLDAFLWEQHEPAIAGARGAGVRTQAY